MGSSKDEEGRFEDEGPRHLVTIEPGFWMFDTPCTQALWEAVMGENPSRFKGPDRPVESVSWDQSQEFLKALNSRIDGLRLSLPSEAQWEYACRAGTETPRYREDPAEIAWYSANIEDGTHSVAGKEPNAWGLYDMLGNVWEWCSDVWVSDYTEESRGGGRICVCPPRDPGWLLARGARPVRAACRTRDEPSYRFDALGFRCAEFRPGS